LSFLKLGRPRRFSRRFKILVAALYVAIFPIAFVILHFARLHYERLTGTTAGFFSDRDTAKLLLMCALLSLVLPVLLLAIVGVLKLFLAVLIWFEARRRPTAR
jgi:hypothetical protein